jgi:hypothetical protein
MQKYLYKAPGRLIGEKTRGRKTHLSKQQEGAAIDTLVLHDRLNDGKTRAQALELIQQLQPSLSSKQVAQALRTTTEKAVNTGKLKSKRVATQATTTKRTAITVERQWRWYRLVDDVDAEHPGASRASAWRCARRLSPCDFMKKKARLNIPIGHWL